MKITVIGGSSVDTILNVGDINSFKEDMMLWCEKKVIAIGGTGAGKALCLGSLGYDVTLVTDLGNDDNGVFIEDYFNKHNVNIIKKNTDVSTTHTNIMYNNGSRMSIFTSLGKDTEGPSEKDINQIKESDIIFLNINSWCKNYIPIIKTMNKLVVVDLHDYQEENDYYKDFIEIANIITLSNINIDNPLITLPKLLNNKEVIVMTKGDKGVITLDKENNFYQMDAYKELPYVDSNGAGDSFSSVFGVKYILTRNIEESLKFATIAGAIACTSYNLFNPKYSYDDLLKIKKSAN